MSGYFGPPRMSDIYCSVHALALLNLSVPGSEELIQWILDRRNADGGWGNVQSDTSHLSFTFYALGILESLGVRYWDERLTDFVLGCRNADGAFGWAPGKSSDIRYTYQALHMLNSAEVSLGDSDSLSRWLIALQNPDGGFGYRIGMPSDAESSHFALACLIGLGQPISALHAPVVIGGVAREKIPENLGVYSAVLEGAGITFGRAESPGYIVEYASRIGLDVLGLKTGNNTFVRQCREYAEAHGLKVDIVASEEQYGVSVLLDPIGTFSHVANIAGRSLVILPRESEWEHFRNSLMMFKDRGGLATLQTSYSPEFCLAVIDDSMSSGGYDAISFADPMRVPWSERYWRVFPMVYSADAHYDLWRTRIRYDRERTLFIAPNGTWEGLREAVELGRIVRVRISGRENPEVVLFGSDAAVEYVSGRMGDWAWWFEEQTFPEFFPHIISRGNPTDANFRGPGDTQELPPEGILVRIHSSVEVLSLWIDGVQTSLERVEGDAFWSPYLVASVARLDQGTHTLTIWWRKGQELVKYEREFEVP